jgi:hypothetical protein
MFRNEPRAFNGDENPIIAGFPSGAGGIAYFTIAIFHSLSAPTRVKKTVR